MSLLRTCGQTALPRRVNRRADREEKPILVSDLPCERGHQTVLGELLRAQTEEAVEVLRFTMWRRKGCYKSTLQCFLCQRLYQPAVNIFCMLELVLIVKKS